MRLALFLCTALFSCFSWAEVIITDTQRIDHLHKQLRENKFYLQVGPVKREIFYFEIGLSETPFYERNSEAKLFYKNENQCFELTVFDDRNIARKVNCYDKIQDLYLEGFEDFKATQIEGLISEGYTSFKAQDLSLNYELLAYTQPYFDRKIIQQIEQSTQQKFHVNLSNVTDVILKKKTLELNQVLTLKVDSIGILPQRTTQSTNKISLQSDGFIFTDGKGKVLLFNSYVSPSYGNYELSINDHLQNYLSHLEERSSSGPVCYRDNYLARGPSDCQKMIFDSHPKTHYTRIKILGIDFINHKVTFIK